MANDFTSKMAALKMEGLREAADKIYSTSPSTRPVMEERRFKGSGGYEYAAMSDGSYKIVKSPRSEGGQFLGPGSEAHKAVAQEDPQKQEFALKSTPPEQIKIERGILKSTPPEQIEIEPTGYGYSTGDTAYPGGVPNTRDYMSSMLKYDRKAAMNWFQAEGGLDPDSAEKQVTAMERTIMREASKGRQDTADRFKKTLQELAKLGAAPAAGATGASYEGE